MRLLLCWAVILDSLCCSTCTRPCSSNYSGMESVVPDGWSSPVPYASHKAGHRALSNWVLRSEPLSVLRRKKETGKAAPSQMGLQTPRVTAGAPLSGEWQEEIQAPLIHLLLNGPATAPRIECLLLSHHPYAQMPLAQKTENKECKWVWKKRGGISMHAYSGSVSL